MNEKLDQIALALELLGGAALLLTALASDGGLNLRTTLLWASAATGTLLLGAGMRALCSAQGRALRRRLFAHILRPARKQAEGRAA